MWVCCLCVKYIKKGRGGTIKHLFDSLAYPFSCISLCKLNQKKIYHNGFRFIRSYSNTCHLLSDVNWIYLVMVWGLPLFALKGCIDLAKNIYILPSLKTLFLDSFYFHRHVCFYVSVSLLYQLTQIVLDWFWWNLA